jgi:hypothetical protein
MRTKPGGFTIRYDSEGNSCNIITNGGQALKVKVDRELLNYRIIDIKNGMILVVGVAPSWKRLRDKVKQDIIAIFSIHPLGSSNIYTSSNLAKNRSLA